VILVPLNGWFIWSWKGAILLFLLWLVVSNSILKRVPDHSRSSNLLFLFTNPFIKVFIGLFVLIGVTIVNLIIGQRT